MNNKQESTHLELLRNRLNPCSSHALWSLSLIVFLSLCDGNQNEKRKTTQNVMNMEIKLKKSHGDDVAHAETLLILRKTINKTNLLNSNWSLSYLD